MNNYLTMKKIWILSITLFAFLLNGCDISDSNTSTSSQELSDEELELAGQILAESLSDQKDGIFASLNDAFTLPSSTNLTANSAEKAKYSAAVFNTAMAKNSGGAENSYSYEYSPDSGVHLVHFNRSINEENFSKQSTAELQYIYYDADEAYIYSPRLDNDKIETIDYQGARTGSIVTPSQNSSYERHDKFLIEGLTSSSGILTIEGLHEGSGEFKVTRDNGDVIERKYTLTIEFLDVQIQNQSVSANQSLDNGVEGALAYEMIISKNINGDESMKTINGTIEFNGDGTALLRFGNILENFKVKIEEGNLLADNEFEGYVRSVDTENASFTLYNDEVYLFGTDTEVDPDGDLTTLEEVQSVIGSGVRVEAEGSYVKNTDEANVLQTVKFEYEDEDLEFEDIVGEINTDGNGSITLADGSVLNLNESTIISPEGDLSTLADAAWALDNDFTVKAEGELTPEDDGSFTITEVKFEYEGEDDFEFEDDVVSVNVAENTFTLADGETYLMDENTEIHEKSDFSTLEEIATALSNGSEVEAEGDYAPQPDGSKLVTKVKFESDDIDNGDDDDENSAEHESEGSVESADAAAKTFSLTNGLTFHVNNNTEFDEDIQSLGNLVGALQRGDKVYAEVEYYIDSDDRNVATEAEFDVERRNGDDEGDDDDDGQEKYEFESDVRSTDLTARSFTLANGLTLFVNSDTEFDDDDIESLEELADALGRGDEVEAEGEYYTDGDGKNIVTEVEFDVERRDDDDDDDGDDGDDDEDREEFDFEGTVNSANSTSFNLGGQTFFVNNDTEFDDGDIDSMQELIDALDNGDEVEAEGEYYIDSNGDNIVIEVEFDVEREEFDFEGLVTSANSSSFNLDGNTYIVNGDTEIEGDGINSMQDLIDALNDGDEVEGEGEYYIDSSGDNIVIEVEFEVEDNDDGEDDDEEPEEFDFEGLVTSAASTSFNLGGNTYFVNGDTDIEGDGINSMQDLIDALNDGDEVEAEGEYYIDSNGDNIVIEVEFEVDENDDGVDGDDDGDDDDGEDGNDDPEEFDFEGLVTSAASTSFNLGGNTYFVNDDTDIEGDGINSMQDLIDALNDGDEVEAEGEYYIDSNGDNIVIEVEFEVDENDDGEDNQGEDDDDDDNDDDDD